MDIREVEKEIDTFFQNSDVLELGYSQAMWELLSYIDNKSFQINMADELSYNERLIATDVLINLITHPLRECYLHNFLKKPLIRKAFTKNNFLLVKSWCDKAYDYYHFCLIFPMYWKKKINISIEGNLLITDKDYQTGSEYEAYNRFTIKTGQEYSIDVDHYSIMKSIEKFIFIYEDRLTISWNKKNAKQVINIFCKSQAHRYHIPLSWQFSTFSFEEFKTVTMSVSALLHARNLAIYTHHRDIVDQGYSSSVWVINKNDFVNSLALYTEIDKATVQIITDYLTLGNMGIKFPDVAIQPLVDLNDGNYALSPFLWTNTDLERNFCVLANKIPKEKSIYAKLVNEKEELLKNRLINDIESLDLGLRCESGKLNDTDVDLAIIDDKEKVALTIELKWFIEPAEAREIIDRSKELVKGISQAKKIHKLYKDDDKTLLQDVLKIDNTYKLTSIVGSFNWVGMFDIQDDEYPIVKVWQLIDIIKEQGSLTNAIEFTKNRKFLPVKGGDYEVIELDVKSDKWVCKWYALQSIN
jgi:hypothetical protein